MRTLFFDLDGTLLDTQAGIGQSIRYTLTQFGFSEISQEVLIGCFGPPLRVSFALLLGTSDRTLLSQAVTLFRQHYLQQGINHYRIYPGIAAMLDQLCRHKLELHVLTAKPQTQAEWLLADAGLSNYFQQIYGSEDQGIRSDKSSHLGHILSQTGVAPRRCWMIGDRAVDMTAAKTNRIAAVAAQWGYASDQELQDCGYDHLIKSPSQLLSLMSTTQP